MNRHRPRRYFSTARRASTACTARHKFRSVPLIATHPHLALCAKWGKVE